MTEGTDFLYPFIEGGEHDADSLLADLATSAAAKGAMSAKLQAATLADCEATMMTLAQVMAPRFNAGGRLFAFGNGGSATDAAGIAALFRRPPGAGPSPPGRCVADQAVAHRPGQRRRVRAGVLPPAHRLRPIQGTWPWACRPAATPSTSSSAFAEAGRRGLLTVGLAGYDGGQMAASPDSTTAWWCASDSVHRIQETQAALVFELWSVRHPGGHDA